MTDPAAPDGPPRAVMIAAIAVAGLAILGVLIVAYVSGRTPPPAPVAVVAVPAPAAEGPECTALAAALPAQMGDYRRSELANPAPAGAAAWRASGATGNDTGASGATGNDTGASGATGNENGAVILRCGIDRPLDFVAGTPVQMVNDVAWFRIADTGRTTWITVDRPVYIALTLPDGSGSVPIQSITEAVSDTMPARPIQPGPAR